MKETFEQSLKKFSEIGYVEEIHSAIIKVSGLPNVRLEEVLLFENGGEGFVYSLDETTIDVILVNDKPVFISEKVARTGKEITVEISADSIGGVLDTLGKPIFFQKSKTNSQKVQKPLFSVAPPISSRVPITIPFETGIPIVDITTPLGRGQRELVLGDRKTGKTQFLLQILRNQVKTNTVCIYCAIGKRETEIVELVEELREPVYENKVTVVASSGHEGIGRIYLTPFTAMAIAEYFKETGKDVFLILDDLSTHAQFYREMALLARRFPGRASYPGDIFHLHAELLERAGSFKTRDNKQSTITCLPVAQSVFGDITGYITTNLMSMTDGHLYLDTEIFDEGRRPALNTFLSVTRVGHETQSPLMRDISREVTSFLIKFKRAQEFSHFGSELSLAVKETLKRGQQIYALFDQNASLVIPADFAAFFLAHIWAGSFKLLEADEIKLKINAGLLQLFKDVSYATKFKSLFNAKDFKSLVLAVSSLPLP